MQDMNAVPQATPPYWVGIDWGSQEHAVCVVDDERRVAASFGVPATPLGFARLKEELIGLAPIGGIAVEATRNPLIAFLSGEGYRIYLINPKLSKNWRAGVSVAGVKSDAGDSHVLALELSRRHESLTLYTPQEPPAAELATLCRDRRGFINERTALVQGLQAVLAQYHPAALAFFNDWTSPAAWRFIAKFPTPQTLAAARKDTLIRFLKANRIGLKPVWLERIENRKTAREWPQAPDEAALTMRTQAIVAQLQALQPHIDRYDTTIQDKAKDLPQTELFATVNGAGPILTPELVVILTDPTATSGGYDALRALAGVAPVTKQSGKRREVTIRRRCNKTWRTTLHLFATSSIHHSRWARAYYDHQRERGNSYATALRKLADKWLKILIRMIKTNQPYNEQRHLESLRKRQSPIYQKLTPLPCG